MAPNFANLYMADLKENYIFKHSTQPLYYRRYIDDIFLLWTESMEQLNTFKIYLNQIHPTIKFTFEVSIKQITYLDVTVHLQGTSLYVSPFFKNTNTFSYVYGNSFHPESTFKGIIKGENIRNLRNCSHLLDYQTTMDFLLKKFKNRSSKPSLLTSKLFHPKIEKTT